MEFILKTNLETALPAEIDFNFEALKAELSQNLKKYKELVVTEDSTKDAKGDKANLNKLRTAIEDKRKEVKKACLSPYDLFEVKIKQIVGMIDEPITTIDKQLKVFENIKIEEKKASITEFYNSNIAELSELLPLVKIYDPCWENVGFVIKDVQKAITDAITQTKTDLQVISSLNSEFESQIKDKYLQSLNLSTALAEKTRLEEQKRKLEEFEAIQAQKKADEQKAREFGLANEQKLAEQIKIEVKEAPAAVGEIQTEVIRITDYEHTIVPNPVIEIAPTDFRVWANNEQLSLLKVFLQTNNIRFGRVL